MDTSWWCCKNVQQVSEIEETATYTPIWGTDTPSLPLCKELTAPTNFLPPSQNWSSTLSSHWWQWHSYHVPNSCPLAQITTESGTLAPQFGNVYLLWLKSDFLNCCQNLTLLLNSERIGKYGNYAADHDTALALTLRVLIRSHCRTSLNTPGHCRMEPFG